MTIHLMFFSCSHNWPIVLSGVHSLNSISSHLNTKSSISAYFPAYCTVIISLLLQQKNP